MAEELELKYLIDDRRAVRRWLDATFPPADDQRWRSFTIIDRYFDTADRALAAAGYGARLRRTGRRTTLTLKSDIDVTGGLHRREELEGDATQELDTSRWPASAARDLLASVVGDRRLIESFVVRQRRRERHLSTGGAVLLASIDTGRVEVAGTDAGPIAQMELERVSGRRAALTRVATLAEASGVARPESRSKLAIATEMAGAAARVQPSDLFAEAGRKVLRRHLLRLLERETPTRAGEQLALKQMRVASRRMRATWRVFGDAFKKPARSRFGDELRPVGQTLGAVRDMDVLLATLGRKKALAPLAAHWQERRAIAFAEAQEMLDSRDYAGFVEDSLAFTAEPGAGVNRRRARATVAETAPAALRAALERLMDAGTASTMSEEVTVWHALRIEGRRFRYSIEAFADVLVPEAAAELLRRVTRMQDHLGAMNDAVVAIDAVTAWLSQAGETVADSTRSATTQLVARNEATIVKLRSSFGDVWRDISDPGYGDLLDHGLEPLTNS